MVNYQPFMSIYVKHQYYNSSMDNNAPLKIIASKKTLNLLMKMGVLLKVGSGFLHLIADAEQFNEFVIHMKNIQLQFYLLSLSPVIRSVTQMPNQFDVSLVDISMESHREMVIDVDTWLTKDDYEQYMTINDIEKFDANMIGVVNLDMKNQYLTRTNKLLEIKYNTISSFWKYYFTCLDVNKNYRIEDLSQKVKFTKTIEKVGGDDVLVFTSDKAISLYQICSEKFSLYHDRKLIYKVLPIPDPTQTSPISINKESNYLSHIYVN